ncbi:MAG: DUF3253 domain-containing protein [Ramlibacter sp.]|nr:DUF3253 domain-containing protein [Ramlibacter sp.]
MRRNIPNAIVELLENRAPEASICPSEVARHLAGDEGSWRRLMEPVRAAAAHLAEKKIVRLTQGDKEVDLMSPIKGPIRIRRGAAWRRSAPVFETKLSAAPIDTANPTTPDGRYFVVRGRLWRKTNPHLPKHEQEALVRQLMDARRALRGKRAEAERAAARQQVDEAKRALGERGPVWWTDGVPDFNRKMAKNTPYAEWFARLASEGQ